MKQHHIEAKVVSEATPEMVWQLLADIGTWSVWGPWDATARARDGSPDPDGVGALRHLRRGTHLTVEEVVAFEPSRRFAYELRGGLPLNDYRAEVSLEPIDGGTLIRWRATFDANNPLVGMFLSPGLSRFLTMVAKRLARAAEAERARPTAA